MADQKLISFNIKSNNLGTRIPLNIEENGDTDVLVFIFNGVKYEVLLKSVETGAILLSMYDQKKMDLTIRYKGKTQVLQRDKSVPASRGFVVDYKFKDVYIQDGRLAIIVEYSVGPGFEGVMDTYQMLVTGRLNWAAASINIKNFNGWRNADHYHNDSQLAHFADSNRESSEELKE